MDPIIRKINRDNQILGLNLEDGTPLDKVCAYADDIPSCSNLKSIKISSKYL